MPQPQRFAALDSWRGICACLVALFHFGSTSHVQNWPMLRGAWLFVDFFFVLSGFVIFASYHDRLQNNFGTGRFLLLRFGRLYPLHFAMLLAFMAAELPKTIPALRGYSPFGPFEAPGSTPPYIVSNLLLIQSLGVHDRLSFNDPSWSISVEFYTYVVFAVAIALLRERIVWLIGLLLIASPVFLYRFSPLYMDTTVQYGIIRCMFGFSAGALCWVLFNRFHDLTRGLTKQMWTAAELGLVAAIAFFVSYAPLNPFSIAAPALFSATILVFAQERGLVSRVLLTRPLLYLGLISYSIYMTHMFVKRKLFVSGALIVQKLTGWKLITMVDGNEWLGRSPLEGDLFALVYLVTVIAISHLTFRWIEDPSRRWFQGWASPRPQPAQVAAAYASPSK